MIYFVGGSPRVGKSIFAERLADFLKADFISTDDLCEVSMQNIDPDRKKDLFPFPSFDGDPAKNTFSPEELTSLQYRSAESLQRDLQKKLDEISSKNIVIEGVHLLPSAIQKFDLNEGSYKSIFIGSCNAVLVFNGIIHNTNPNNWLRDSDPVVIRQVAEFVAAFSRRIKQDATAFGFDYFERTEDFEKDLSILEEMILRSK